LNLELTDLLIAATARVHKLSVATLNRKHFEKLGVELVEFEVVPQSGLRCVLG
jgi:predicted nucleic acid-binding protein